MLYIENAYKYKILYEYIYAADKYIKYYTHIYNLVKPEGNRTVLFYDRI